MNLGIKTLFFYPYNKKKGYFLRRVQGKDKSIAGIYKGPFAIVREIIILHQRMMNGELIKRV